jgi:hypothetical protein
LVVARRDKAEHEATCQHRTEPCGVCGLQAKAAELAQHELVCPRRQVDCNNDGCDARVAFDKLSAHKAHLRLYQRVDCPFADVGCTARVLRKDVDNHEDAALKRHNRLLLGKVKEQMGFMKEEERFCGAQLHELEEAYLGVRTELEEVKDELGNLETRIKDLGRVDVTVRVKHAVLTGREPLVPQYPDYPTRVYSKPALVQGHVVWFFVDTNRYRLPMADRDYYGLGLEVGQGDVPCAIARTFKLVHRDGNSQSAVKRRGEHTLTVSCECGDFRFIRKARLASADNNPYVKDGYVTFKCTFKFVDE